MVRRRWELHKGLAARKERAARLSEEYGLPAFAALLALGRGVAEEELPAWLGVGEDEPDGDLLNPFDLPDMELAVERIDSALERGEHITVFGDYDCDGVSAVALLYGYLRGKTDQVSWYLPDRHKEGYGLNMAAIDALAERGAQLIVTVDNGTAAAREIAHAKALGIDTVVTDHHQIGNELPPACAVVNPHRQEFALPFREYTGAAIAFFLVCALEGREPEELLEQHAALVALGAIADVAPLRGDNRAIARAGIRQIDEWSAATAGLAPGLGIMALLRMARGGRRPCTASTFSFAIGPRVNAAGRMGLAEDALQLLLTNDSAEAERLAQKLELYNEERQQTEREIMAQALRTLEERPQLRHDRVLVFAGEGWHDGVIGIAAARLLERFGRPVFMITISGDAAKGSGRSIPGFHMFEAVHHCAHLMQKYGGHELAAGFSLPAEHVEQFRAQVNQYAKEAGEMPSPVQPLDLILNPAWLTPALADEIALLEPFGQGNPQPVFALKGLTLVAATPLSGGKHLRLTLEQNGRRFNAMAFHTARDEFRFEAGDAIDLAVTIETNEYMGEREVTLIVRNTKFSALPNEELLRAQRLVEQVLRREPTQATLAAAICPTRADAAAVFRAVRARPGPPLPPERILLDCGADGTAEEMARLWLAAQALCELGVLLGDGQGCYAPAQSPEKRAFESAEIVKFLNS
ncbi:MAG: single-stranded-DNA-specific exonuclease RecJ [Oscillospiraceae bacterium]|jgi:single-stranded-DNA-specific exonuclease|nr:single-stranded-DNA-specific exonuclease RecJ [Oscillospiraceae bacterium]